MTTELLEYADEQLDAFALLMRGAVIRTGRDQVIGADLPMAEFVRGPHEQPAPQIQTLVNPAGGTVWDPYYGRWTSWRPVGPVVDAWIVVDQLAELILSGVLGNYDHWNKPDAGDHTSRSTHCVTVSGIRVCPRTGYVYAIDISADEAILRAIVAWILAEVRAGRLGELKYFNALGQHWHRNNNWQPVPSADRHLHLSFMPGWELRRSTLLSDFWAHHTGEDLDDMEPTQIHSAVVPVPENLAAHYPDGIGTWPETGGTSQPTVGYLLHMIAADLKKLSKAESAERVRDQAADAGDVERDTELRNALAALHARVELIQAGDVVALAELLGDHLTAEFVALLDQIRITRVEPPAGG